MTNDNSIFIYLYDLCYTPYSRICQFNMCVRASTMEGENWTEPRGNHAHRVAERAFPKWPEKASMAWI